MIKLLLTSTLTLLAAYPANTFNYNLPGLNWGANKEEIKEWTESYLFTDNGGYFSSGTFAGIPVTNMFIGYCPSSGLHKVEFRYRVYESNYKSAFRDLNNFLKDKYGTGTAIYKFANIPGKSDYEILKLGKGYMGHFWKEVDSTIVLEMSNSSEIKLIYQSMKHAHKCLNG